MSNTDPMPGTTAATSTPGGALGLPVLPPLAALVEVLVLVIVPGLLDLFVPAFPALNEIQPHPFWLPVLLLSVQYGSVSGLMAAGAAIVFSALLGWPDQEIGENHFSYLLRIWLQPVLWLATAVVLGQFRLRQIERMEALAGNVAELSSQRQAIAQHASDLRGRCEELERVIAVRRDPEARRLMAALGRIQAPDPDAAKSALQEAATLAFGDCCLSVWVKEAGRLRLADRLGASAGPSSRQEIATTEPLAVAVAGEGRLLCVMTAGDERDLAGWGVAAAPLHGAGQSVAGLLLLERSDAAELDATLGLRLTALAGIVGQRMVEAAATMEPITLARGGRTAVTDVRLADRGWRQVRWRAAGRRQRTGGRSG